VTAIDLREARRLAFSLVLAQAGVTLAAALVSLAVVGALAGRSALLGGGISTLASLAMALVAFGGRTSASAERALIAFYAGEALKLAVVVAAFVAVLRLIKVSPGAMLVAYGATFAVYWVVLARALKRGGGIARETV
jgi:ATP synthase protein I